MYFFQTRWHLTDWNNNHLISLGCFSPEIPLTLSYFPLNPLRTGLFPIVRSIQIILLCCRWIFIYNVNVYANLQTKNKQTNEWVFRNQSYKGKELWLLVLYHEKQLQDLVQKLFFLPNWQNPGIISWAKKGGLIKRSLNIL